MSPIRVLDERLIDSIARIAPEKSNEIEKFRARHYPCVVFTNDKKFSFRVDTELKEIKLPTAGLECLWCACYAFYVIYQEYCAKIDSQVGEFNLNENARAQAAISLYKWGVDQLEHDTPKDWPNDKLRPIDSEDAHEDIKVANELYLCSAAWILHHEIGHIIHGHENEPISDEQSRAQEKEADETATKWILDGVEDEAVLKKRGLGVVIAILVITSQDILAGEFKATTHPKSFQRLYDAMTPYFDDQDHLVYSFSTVICYTHMSIRDMKIQKNDNETWKENLESCLVQLNRLTMP